MPMVAHATPWHEKGHPEGCPSFPGGEARIRTGGEGFAGPCLTTWPLRRYEKGRSRPALVLAWSGLRGSNPRPPPWQGGALPTALSPQAQRIIYGKPRPRASPNLKFVGKNFGTLAFRKAEHGRSARIRSVKPTSIRIAVSTRGIEPISYPPAVFPTGTEPTLPRPAVFQSAAGRGNVGFKQLPGTEVDTDVGSGRLPDTATTVDLGSRRSPPLGKKRKGLARNKKAADRLVDRLQFMERATGFEPATSTLARWRATNCAKPA